MLKTLKEHRIDAYLSLRELSERSGVAVRTLWRIENGKNRTALPRTMRAIAEALSVQPSQIVEFVPPHTHEARHVG